MSDWGAPEPSWGETNVVSEAAASETSGDQKRYTGVSLTLKADGAYDAPWYVIHGRDAADILEQLNDPNLGNLLRRVTEESVGWSLWQSKAKGLNPAPTQQRQTPAPSQQTQQAAPSSQPAGPAPSCGHGDRVWKDFTSKAGNHVQGWFCPTNVDGCKPLFKPRSN